MNKKKIGAIVAAGLLSTSMISFANNTTQNTTQPPQHKRELTAEQKAQRDAIKAKWNALSASQKNEVYQIESEITALRKKQIDKLVSLGVIDKTKAEEQKKALDDKLAELKSNSQMPRIKGDKGRGSQKGAPSKTNA